MSIGLKYNPLIIVSNNQYSMVNILYQFNIGWFDHCSLVSLTIKGWLTFNQFRIGSNNQFPMVITILIGCFNQTIFAVCMSTYNSTCNSTCNLK